MNPKCPQCGTTKDEVARQTGLHRNFFLSSLTAGLHVYEYADDPRDTIWACLECGCHFRGDGRRVSMLGHILGPNPVHKPITLTGVKKR